MIGMSTASPRTPVGRVVEADETADRFPKVRTVRGGLSVKSTAIIRTRITRVITLGAVLIIGLSVLVMAAPRALQRAISPGRAGQTESKGAQPRVSHAELPLSFEPNLGQTERQATFVSHGYVDKHFMNAGEDDPYVQRNETLT